MFRILSLLFLGHWHSHKWILFREYALREGQKIVQHKLVFKCEVCGKLKQEKIKADLI